MRAPAVLGSLAPVATVGSARFANLLTVAPAAALPRASGVPVRGRSVRPDGAVAPVGPLPATSAGAAGAMASGSPPPPAPYALLAAALALAAVLLSRLICVPARGRPVLFISLLERPG
jgi:hypothetical protein